MPCTNKTGGFFPIFSLPILNIRKIYPSFEVTQCDSTLYPFFMQKSSKPKRLSSGSLTLESADLKAIVDAAIANDALIILFILSNPIKIIHYFLYKFI